MPAIVGPNTARIVPGNARDLNFVDANTVDIVLTDPPYYDNVAYSELSDFFQPWLSELGLVPKPGIRRTAIRGALRAARSDDASIESFAAELGEAFSEIHRVLKPKGLLAFTFRHSTPNAWLAMGKALAKSQLRPIQVLPLPGEAGSGLHTHGGTSLWDAVLVFRKIDCKSPQETLTHQQIESARTSSRQWRERFRRQDRVPFNVADYVNLFRASLVAASLGLFGKSGAEQTPLGTALNEADPK